MLVAGNWKMNTDLITARTLARNVVEAVGDPGEVKVVVCPPFISLHAVSEIVRNSPVDLGAQNMHEADSGAFTGEVSAAMLRSVGSQYVILGHSERRQYFGETNEGVNRKIKKALASDILPIVCVGENLDQRKGGAAQNVVGRQIGEGLGGVDVEDAERLVVAYEPIWAIGTGETATPAQAQEMHAFIRSQLTDRYGDDTGAAIHILYGGSVKPHNADELFAQDDVDGGLIGGASLKADDFAAIVDAAR
ncbi:MAG: triose-phosphate isomerase [Rhodothermales bacterium]